jgi:hypothetical protein
MRNADRGVGDAVFTRERGERLDIRKAELTKGESLRFERGIESIGSRRSRRMMRAAMSLQELG